MQRSGPEWSGVTYLSESRTHPERIQAAETLEEGSAAEPLSQKAEKAQQEVASEQQKVVRVQQKVAVVRRQGTRPLPEEEGRLVEPTQEGVEHPE